MIVFKGNLTNIEIPLNLFNFIMMLCEFLFCLSLALIISVPLMCIITSFSTSALLKEYYLIGECYAPNRSVFIRNLDLKLRVLPFYSIGFGMPLLFVSDLWLFLENPEHSEGCFLWVGITLFIAGGLDSIISLKGHRNIFKTIISRCRTEQEEAMSDKGSFLRQFMNGNISMRMFLMAFGIASMVLYGLIWFDNSSNSF